MIEPKRKPGRPVAEPTRPATLRLKESQHAEYMDLGGARWVKRLIDESLARRNAAPAGKPPA